jgi:hypothetical protein
MATKRDEFFTMIPMRSALVVFTAVFFIFAPLAILLVSSPAQQRPVSSTLFLMVISGLVAVCWAVTFTVSRWFAIGIVVFSFVLAILSGPGRSLPLGAHQVGFSWVSVLLIASIVLGYILLIYFISAQGRTTVRLMTEMALARRIHDTLVPPIDFANDRLEAHGLSMASSEMGGDLIDLVDHGDATDLFLADVSGHGVRAGVVMGMIKSALRMGLERRGALDDLTRELNDVLDRTTSPELYATLAGMRVDHSDNSVTCLLAGHHHLLHLRAATSEMARVAYRNFPVGMMADQTFSTGTIATASGDLLGVYTDGLNETANAADEELGHDAIERVIVENSDRPLHEIQRAVFDLVDGHGPQLDDRTLLLVRLK